MGTKDKAAKNAHRPDDVEVRPLAPHLMDDMAVVLKGSWGSNCCCMFPRLKDEQFRDLPGEGSLKERRCAAMTKLARRKVAPGLLAYEHGEPVGWIAVGPRREFARVDASRATPPVDDQDVWIIPCVTVRKTARGRGIAVALIKAAVQYAFENRAPTVEAYPRVGGNRVSDDNIYFGTEPLFRRAGFETVRGPLSNRPKNWPLRLAMRVSA